MGTKPNRLATVIGGSGFIGSQLISHLKCSGVDLRVPARGDEADLRGSYLGDLYYCAGMTADFAKQPAKTAEAHVQLVARLLETCRYKSVVYLSSTRLYDRTASSISQSRPLLESDCLMLSTTNPRHLYDLTKAAGEAICLGMAGEKAAIARLACVWDVGTAATGFVPSIIKDLRSRYMSKTTDPLTVHTGLSVRRHYIHINDAIRAIQALACLENAARIVSLASDAIPIKNDAILRRIESVSSIPIVVSHPSATEANNLASSIKPCEILCSPQLDLSAYHELVGPHLIPPPFLEDLEMRLQSEVAAWR